MQAGIWPQPLPTVLQDSGPQTQWRPGEKALACESGECCPGATSEHLLPSKGVLQVGLRPALLALSPAVNAEGSRAMLAGCTGIWASSHLRR